MYGLHEKQLEGIFMNGLKPEMREVVEMCKPVNLPEIFSLALQMESSSIYRVVSRDMQQENKNLRGYGTNTGKSNLDTTTKPAWKMKTITNETVSQSNRPWVNGSNRPIH